MKDEGENFHGREYWKRPLTPCGDVEHHRSDRVSISLTPCPPARIGRARGLGTVHHLESGGRFKGILAFVVQISGAPGKVETR